MTDDARTNLLAAIAEKATTADVADLSTLATAYQQVVHGPQGGAMDYANNTHYDYDARIRQGTEQHTVSHQHNHLAGERNGAGFAPGP